MAAHVKAGAEVAEIWAEYRATNGRALRDHLVLHYAALVKYVAGRIAVGLPASVDRADLVSAGIVGLLEAGSRTMPIGFRLWLSA